MKGAARMARFLDSMKGAENGHHHPPAHQSTPPGPPLTLVAPESTPEDLTGQEPADEEANMPFIEVGPSRSVEGSPDVLAYRPVPPLQVPAVADASQVLSFRPLPVRVEAPSRVVPEVIAFHEPTHPVSGQYRELLTAIVKAAPPRTNLSLLFTGSASGVGTTTVVLNLAVPAARQGQRVVVVDGNGRRPAIAARLALCDRPGLNEVLAGTAALDDSLQDTEIPELTALTSGAAGAAAPRSVEAYRSLLRQLRQRFDLALIDGPRWDGRPEVIAPGAASDAAFLVVPAGSEDSPAIQELLRQIPGQGVLLAGCISATR
jgi:Mrp family chromosome partitioning ATPase